MPFSDPAALLSEYGYAAILIGTFLEGETIVIIAGFLAHQGYLHAPYVALAAFCGSTASDQLMYQLARHKGDWLLRRFPRLASGVEKIGARLRGREIWLILSFRFIYGVRNITPVFLGLHKTPPRLFVPLNAASAAVWATAFTAGGYFFGSALTVALGRLHSHEPYVLGGLAVAAVVYWLWRRKRGRR